MNARTIAIINQKGGVGKTMTTFSLGVGLARAGKRVLLIDLDPQGSLTISCGFPQPDEIETTTYTVLNAIVNAPVAKNTFGFPKAAEASQPPIDRSKGLLQYSEVVSIQNPDGNSLSETAEIHVDLLPANIELAGMENELLLCTMRDSRSVLKEYVQMQSPYYDYILIDCLPSLGLLSINALTAADSVLIPLTADYLPIKGLTKLIDTISTVKMNFNPKLDIEGILITMFDSRNRFAHDTEAIIRENYGDYVFSEKIPSSVAAKEATAQGISIFAYKPRNKRNSIAPAYQEIVDTILAREI